MTDHFKGIEDEIREGLFLRRDSKYRDFQSRLIPTAAPEAIIGVRTPDLRKYAKELSKRREIEAFLQKLPHRYFDENQLHAFLLSEMKDYGRCIEAVNAFLPNLREELPAVLLKDLR